MLKNAWDDLMQADPKIVGVVVILITLLVSMVLTETPTLQAARREAFYQKIGIDGVADIAANKREINRIHRGALIKLRSGDLVEVRIIIRDILGHPKRLEGLDQSGASRRLNVENVHCLYEIQGVIHQGDARYGPLSDAMHGRIDTY